ncbi:MAG: PepSY domain-containing protein [Lactobacillaceae bacterium]|nr:PepSY domain-containing protein [Lactobacillaceae bacterium]
MTENGNTLAIFDRNGNTDELIKTSKLVSAKKIEKILEENKFKKINNISPSIYKKVPVYEISFFAKNGTLSYLTIDIKNGEIYRKITGV